MSAPVSSLQRPTQEPEQILRNALARCAEIRATGVEPYVVVMLGADHELPSFAMSPILSHDLSACAMRCHLAALDHVRDVYGSAGQ